VVHLPLLGQTWLRLAHQPHARRRRCSLARRWLDYTNASINLIAERGGEPALERGISLLVRRNAARTDPFTH